MLARSLLRTIQPRLNTGTNTNLVLPKSLLLTRLAHDKAPRKSFPSSRANETSWRTQPRIKDNQTSFSDSLRSQRSPNDNVNIRNENATKNESQERHSEGQKSSQSRPSPIPDLRQGIPSTFETEFLKQKEQATRGASRDRGDINVTEDPRKAQSGAYGGRGGGELPKSAYETSTDRRRNRQLLNSLFAFGLLGICGYIYFGRDWETEEEIKAHPDAPNGWNLTSMWQRANARFGGQIGYYTEPTFPKLLPTMDPPPPVTLVLSLEDLLIHNEWSREHGWRTAKRPGLDYFLRYLCQYYEIVVFTTLPFAAADLVVKKLDPYRITIMWPLFREATRYEKGQYIKDLSYLNRDLSKVIMVDTKAEHAKYQPENTIILPKWDGKLGDRGLVDLIPFLEHIATMGVQDVRKAIKSFEGTHIPTEFARREAKSREQFKQSLAAESSKKPKRSAGGFLMGALGMKSQGGMMLEDGKTVAEGFAQGKTLSDQVRERGMKQYEALEKEIRENGDKWLKEFEADEKRMQEEWMKSMKSGFVGWLPGSGSGGPMTEEKR